MELDKVNRAIASHYDRTKYGVRATQNIYPQELQARQAMLSQMYVTLEINREQAKAQLQETIPVIQVLDRPLPPHSKVKRSTFVYLFLGLVIGFLLSAFWVCRKMLLEDATILIKEQLAQAQSNNKEADSEEE